MSAAYRHVDVFASAPFTGNSLAVFPEGGSFSYKQMLAITQELRHFESIFLASTETADTYQARVFDLFEELDFAGHPILGAAAVLHEQTGSAGPRRWTFELPRKTVEVTTEPTPSGYSAVLDQGRPQFLGEVPKEASREIAEALSLPPEALADLPLEAVSTGLKYLIVPVVESLSEAGIIRADFAELIGRFGAQFAYLVDIKALEGRHWNNDGIFEDVATGSAAGCVGAYLAKHHVVPTEEEFVLHQGRFMGRPSMIRVKPQGQPNDLVNIQVGGEIAMVAVGNLDHLPEQG
ncbi:PhzF family phenazine biosynthesis protein [Streptomyces sp. NPDC093149]|uniref:PhzF family phenazine biosynthesis protein n=1 Tax=Streptomyces sp. NPDC093149 TaxID=3366031 RepID=UPI003815BFFE